MKTGLVRRGKLAGGLGPLLALCLIVALAVPTLAQPPSVPQEEVFWGTVTICETLAGEGTVVTAKIDGAVEEWTSFVVYYEGWNGFYGLDDPPDYTNNLLRVPADDPDTPGIKEGGVEGVDNVEFWVLDKKVTEVPFEAKTTTTRLDLALTEVDLTVNSGTGGTVTDPGVGTFPRACGVEVNLLADPDPGYEFDEWTGDVASVAAINDSTADDTFITMNGFYEITAHFKSVVPPEPHDLTVTSEGCCPIDVAYDGFSDQVPAGGNETFTDIPFGTDVELEALPPDCCNFVEWAVDGGDPVGDNPITVTMNADHTAVATCTEVGLLTLTVDVVGEGDVEVNDVAPGAYPEEYPFECCTNVGLNAIEADGWFFAGWSDDLGGSTNPTTIHMDGNKTVTANFTEIGETNLTVNTTPGGTVTDPGVGTFPYDTGTEVDLVAEPDQCASFVNWTGEVGMVDDINAATTTITMNDDYTITANFESLEVLTTIPLSTDYNGWNTFSTPIYLDPCCDTWENLFALSGIENEDVGAIYCYNGSTGQWDYIMGGTVQPLEGYYLKLMNLEDEISISIVPYWDNPDPDIPPSKELAHQLNFIGTPSLVNRDVVTALSAIYLIEGVGYSRVINPEENPNDWLEADYYRGDTSVPTMVAFKAYWVIMGWWEGPVYLYGSLPPPMP